MRAKSSFDYYLVNLNLANIIVGYVFFVSIFMPFTSNEVHSSQLVTVPYRIFSLLLSLAVLLLSIKWSVKVTLAAKIFMLFWAAFLLRMYYDLEIRTDFFVFDDFKRRIWSISIGSCLMPMVSIMRSRHKLDLDFCFKIVYGALFIAMLTSFSFLTKTEVGTRETGNAAIDPITFSLSGCSLFLMGLYKIITVRNLRRSHQIAYCLGASLGLFLALKTGSRGPFLGLMLILVIWYGFASKRGSFWFLGMMALTFFLKDFVIQAISLVSPFIGKRISLAIVGEDHSMLARQESYRWFFDKIIEFPVLGSQFARLGNGTYPGYAHNIFLDVSIGLGFFGLGVFCYCVGKSFSNFKQDFLRESSFWIYLVGALHLFLSFSSGAFYSNPPLNGVFILALLGTQRIIKRRISYVVSKNPNPSK